ncbi:ribonuclease H-like domain-containing protein [Leucosporidium creatinivorum]|uniref:Ribonuclease H-like domain-containing protein n=1 Tax=Leucosporidium creatinivorum TaxID=106004 RepID=A0A1Y2FRY2_9BASI|nr:ribonuclease H-like domain-containing protein [Leucosporidium creatinivorum]
MADLPSPVLVDNVSLLEECLEEICDVEILAIGFQGRDLGATGSLALVQVHVQGSEFVWLLDVKELGRGLFEHEHYGVSIRAVLEDGEIRKLWFDGRNGCAALSRFGIHLEGIYDVQLLFLAWFERNVGPTRHLSGLATIMKDGVTSSYDGHLKASAIQIAGPDFGEFEKRPLSDELMRYAAQDTSCLFEIYDLYKGMVRKNVAGRVLRDTRNRIEQAESSRWDPHSRENTKVPLWW